MWRVIIIVFLAIGVRLASAQDEVMCNQKDYSKFVSSIEGDVNIWRLEPTDEKWDKFKFVKIENNNRSSILALFKNGKFSEKGGEYYWLEMPQKDRQKIGEGLLILEHKGKIVYGFRYTATMVNRKGLGLITVKRFDPSSGIIEWQLTNFLYGVILDSDVRVNLK